MPRDPFAAGRKMNGGRLADRDLVIDGLEQVATHGVPGLHAASMFDVGTGSYLDFIECELVGQLVSTGGASCRFFEGPYGSGKTHLLSLFRERALDRGMAVVQTELSSALSLDDWPAITAYILENLEMRVDGTSVRSLPRILEGIGGAGGGNREQLRAATLPHPGFKEALLEASSPMLPRGMSTSALRRFLSGEKVLAIELRTSGFRRVKHPLTRRNAEAVLSTVLSGLHTLGVPGTVLLFDENERTLQSRRATPPKRLRVAANLMRRLIDACTSGSLAGTLAVFAVLPGFLEDCAIDYPALGQRIAMPRDDLHSPAWRWPVLPVSSVNTVSTPEEFLAGAAETLCRIVESNGKPTRALKRQMLEEGQGVLEKQAGSGYRRPLMKALARIALDEMEA